MMDDGDDGDDDRRWNWGFNTKRISKTIIWIVIFAVAFTIIGTLLPSLYASLVPTENYIEVHSLEAEDISANDTTQELLFHRTVDQPFRGDVIIELILIEHDTERQISTLYEVDYFEEGNRTVVFERPLPEERLQTGRYYYRMHISFEVNDVKRSTLVKSNVFEVTNASANATNVSEGNTTNV